MTRDEIMDRVAVTSIVIFYLGLLALFVAFMVKGFPWSFALVGAFALIAFVNWAFERMRHR